MSFDRRHVAKANGIWELPFGKGKRFGAGAPAWLGHVIGGWQTGSILTIQTGAPISFGAVRAFNTAGNNTPVPVGAFPSDFGEVRRTGTGVVYFTGLKQVLDPYVAQITAVNGIQQRSTMLAVTDAGGKVLLLNPQPGQLGMGPRLLTGPGLFQLDLNLLKRISFRERYEFTLRADAINFGVISGTSAEPRVVVVSARFSF